MESLARNLYLKKREALPNLTEILQFFFRNRNIALKMLNFHGILPQKETLGATFNETRALSSVKYVAQQGINVPIFLEIYELIGLHFFQKILSIMFIFDVFSRGGDSLVVLKVLEIH